MSLLKELPEEAIGYSVSRLEAYSKLIAMTIVGAEEAIGSSLMGGLVNMIVKRLREELGVGKPSNIANAISWFNKNTVLRLNTYRAGGRLVREENGKRAFYLIAYECPIRQILYLEDLPGGGPLCLIVCRLLSTVMSDAINGRCTVEPARIGPNACLLRAVIPPQASEAVESTPDIVSEKPSLEEYERLLYKFYGALLRSIGWALYNLLAGNPAMSYRAGKSYGKLVGASILARGFEPANLREAAETINTSLRGLISLEVDGDTIRVTSSLFDSIIREESIEHPEFIERTVQGFIAGVIEALLSKRVDLRSTREKSVYKVIVHG